MEDYFYIENTTGLIAEAQMGTLEFHIWGSRVDQLEKPDMIVFVLDPDERMDLSRVRQGDLLPWYDCIRRIEYRKSIHDTIFLEYISL